MSANAACAVARTDSGVSAPRPLLLFHTFRSVSSDTWLKIVLTATVLGALSWAGLASYGRFHRNRSAIISTAVEDLDILASLAARESTRLVGGEAVLSLEGLVRALPRSAVSRSRTLVLADSLGLVIASYPALAAQPRTVAGLLGDAQPLDILADRVGAMPVRLADGREVVAAVRNLPAGQIVLMQPMAEILADLHAQVICELAAAIFVLAISGALGTACYRQLQRTRSDQQDFERASRRLNASLSRGRCGLWDWDIARGRIVWSDSMYDLLGYERRDEFLSFGELKGLIHPQDADLYRLAEEVASLRTHHIDSEFRIRSAAGSWIWLRTRAETVVEPSDGTRHLVGIAIDVTDERMRAENDAAADARLRDAVEAISEAFVLWDADNRLVLCNSKFRRLHDLPTDVVVPGAPYAEMMEAGRPPVVEHQLSRDPACPTGARSVEAQLSDGRWLQINERRTKDGGFVSVGTDITDLKRHEAQLLDSESRLLQTIADLRLSRQTLELQKQQLADLAERNLDQKAEAESANRAKTEFLAKMSHELRTPLNAIINFADIMQTGMFGPIDGRYADYSRDIHQSGLYLLSVINDILDMSRIEAGRMELRPSVVALEPAITRAVTLVGEQARGKNIELSVCVRCEQRVIADDRAFQQILTNVLQNAVKFTPRDGAISVRARRAGTGVNLFIADSGIGIPQTALAKIGRPFEQVEHEFSRSHKGSGLGLAIARSLAELHGGDLRIRSQPGLGTVVLVHLPELERNARTSAAAPDKSAAFRFEAA